MEFANISYNPNLIEYLSVILFFVIAVGIIGLALTLSYLISPKYPNNSKLLPYECGFDAFDNASKQFNVRFYLIGILFLIFDLEVVFMYPWAMSIRILDNVGFYSMLIFIAVLVVGFIYEWKKGALRWD